MSEINNDFFLRNLHDAAENLSDYPYEEEQNNFIIDGELLHPLAQLVYEKNRILVDFIELKGQSFPFAKRDDFKKVIKRLTEEVNHLTVDYETIKKIIVHLDLELGLDVNFTSSLSNMLEETQEFVGYEYFDTFDFETLYEKYAKKPYRRLK